MSDNEELADYYPPLDDIQVTALVSRDDSDIPLNTDKLKEIPDGWQELSDYSESWESSGNGDRSRAEVTRTFQGPWGSRKEFIDWALGFSDNVGGILTRSVPAQHPEYPWLYAVSATNVKGQGLFIQNPNYDPEATGIDMIAFIDRDTQTDAHCCRVQVRYTRLMYTIRDDRDIALNSATELQRYIIRTRVRSLRSQPLPPGQLVFQGTATPIPSSAGNILSPMQELTYRWMQVPDLPEKAFDLCQGCVNDKAFDPAFMMNGRLIGFTRGGYPAGTLLCQAPETIEDRGVTGREQWTIVYKFIFNRNGWNKFPDANGNYVTAVYQNNPNKMLYDAVDFMQLFTQPNPPTLYY
jgi:hypothetical protein